MTTAELTAPPLVAERVYQHVKRLAAQQGVEVRERNLPRPIEERIECEGSRLTGIVLHESLPPLCKSWLVAVDLGLVACSVQGCYPWTRYEGDEVPAFDEAKQFAGSLIASLTAAELMREVQPC